MASIIKRPNRHRWVQFTNGAGKRQTIRLGKTPAKVAEAVNLRVEILIAAKIDRVPRTTRQERSAKSVASEKSDPKGTRTPVTAVKGRCPRPLDDGASSAIHARRRREFDRQQGAQRANIPTGCGIRA
jgi:hypothetical protein